MGGLSGLSGMTGLSAFVSRIQEVVTPSEFDYTKIDLSSHFNLVGMTDITNNYGPGDNTGIDGFNPGQGDSTILYPGESISWGGFDFNIGPVNTENTIKMDGQTLSMTSTGNALILLGTATNTNSYYNAGITINYTDSSSETWDIRMSDWFNNEPPADNFEYIAYTTTRRKDNNGPVHIFAYVIPVDRNKTVTSVSLPSITFTYLFAMNFVRFQPVNSFYPQPYLVNAGAVDEDNVTIWSDSSADGGLSNNGSGGITYRSIPNNENYVSFDGSTYLTGNFSVQNNQPYTIFSVFRQQNANTAVSTNQPTVSVSFGATLGGPPTFWTGFSGPRDGGSGEIINSFVTVSQSVNDMHSNTNPDNTDWNISVGISDGSILKGYANGDYISSRNITGASIGSVATAGGYVQSGVCPWIGDVGEILVFDWNMSDTDRRFIEKYLIYKYQN